MGLTCLYNAISYSILTAFKAIFFTNRFAHFLLSRYPFTIFNLLIHVDNVSTYQQLTM